MGMHGGPSSLCRVEMICGLLAQGESEQSACIRAGIGLTAWNTAKRSNAGLRQRIAEARDDWARLRHAAALYESRSMRLANRKALKPEPTRQAKLLGRIINAMILWFEDHNHRQEIQEEIRADFAREAEERRIRDRERKRKS